MTFEIGMLTDVYTEYKSTDEEVKQKYKSPFLRTVCVLENGKWENQVCLEWGQRMRARFEKDLKKVTAEWVTRLNKKKKGRKKRRWGSRGGNERKGEWDQHGQQKEWSHTKSGSCRRWPCLVWLKSWSRVKPSELNVTKQCFHKELAVKEHWDRRA